MAVWGESTEQSHHLWGRWYGPDSHTQNQSLPELKLLDDANFWLYSWTLWFSRGKVVLPEPPSLSPLPACAVWTERFSSYSVLFVSSSHICHFSVWAPKGFQPVTTFWCVLDVTCFNSIHPFSNCYLSLITFIAGVRASQFVPHKPFKKSLNSPKRHISSIFVFNQFGIRGPVAWLLACPFEKSSFLLCLLVVDVWTKWKWLVCVGGWINALISVRSHGNQGQELSFIDFIPMTSKQKSPFLRVIKRCSPYPYLRKNAHVASFLFFPPRQHLLRMWGTVAHVANVL